MTNPETVRPGRSFFLRIVDRPCAKQLQHSVCPHFRVDAQMLVIGRARKYGIGYRADSHLKRRTIFDQACGEVRDLLLLLGGRQRRYFGEGIGDLDRMINLADMDQAVSVNPGHVRVDLRDDDFSDVHRGASRIDARPQGAVTMSVGGRDVNQRDVEREPSGAEKLWDLGEETWKVIDKARFKFAAQVRADEERRSSKAFAVSRIGVLRISNRVEVQPVLRREDDRPPRPLRPRGDWASRRRRERRRGSPTSWKRSPLWRWRGFSCGIDLIDQGTTVFEIRNILKRGLGDLRQSLFRQEGLVRSDQDVRKGEQSCQDIVFQNHVREIFVEDSFFFLIDIEAGGADLARISGRR